MRKSLPARPSLEHLKSQAKDLLDAYRGREPAALERFRESLPAARGADDERLAAMSLALHDAQSVVAREYGFAGWSELKARVESAALSRDTLRALMAPHLGAPLPDEVQQSLLDAASETSPEAPALPASLPLLPLRNALLPPAAVAPLQIGRPASLSAVDAARAGDGLLAIFAQKSEANEAPTAADLHPVGCVARLVSVTPAAAGGSLIVVRALCWARLEAVEPPAAHLRARVAPFAVSEEQTAETRRLEQLLRERVRAFTAALLPRPEPLLQMVERMNVFELADAALANLPCSVDDKAKYACEPSLLARLELVLALFDKAA